MAIGRGNVLPADDVGSGRDVTRDREQQAIPIGRVDARLPATYRLAGRILKRGGCVGRFEWFGETQGDLCRWRGQDRVGGRLAFDEGRVSLRRARLEHDQDQGQKDPSRIRPDCRKRDSTKRSPVSQAQDAGMSRVLGIQRGRVARGWVRSVSDCGPALEAPRVGSARSTPLLSPADMFSPGLPNPNTQRAIRHRPGQKARAEQR